MKIGFDARMIHHSGIGTYSRELLKLLTQKQDLDFTLFGDLVKLSNYPAKKVYAPFPIYSAREQLFFPLLLNKNPVQLLHVPHYNAPLGTSTKLVVTVHDIIHLKFPPSRLAYIYARGMIEAVCKKAKKIITVSNHAKEDLINVLGIKENKIKVVYNAVSPVFSESNGSDQKFKEKYGDYALYVGNLKSFKNVLRLIQAFVLAKEKIKEMKLILIGKNFMAQETLVFEKEKDIIFLGEVPFSDLSKFYRNAKYFVFPSLYEGFGLPPLEAMASGTPVICSNAASLPEVVGEAALLFDPTQVQELAKLMVELWENEGQRKKLIAKGLEQAKKFSWDKAAQEILKVYEEVAG